MRQIEVENVTKVYGKGASKVTAVDGVLMHVDKGEMVLIMGPSGSGKTTLLSMIGCLLRPDSGRIRLMGEDVTAMAEEERTRLRRVSIGFIFQSFNLLSSLTALENVEVAMSLVGIREDAGVVKAGRLLTELGLGRRLEYLPRDLSGGEKQRVAIVRALANDPQIILADEPTGNLDSRLGREVAEMLHQVAKKQGKTVLIVSHDYRITDAADRLLWLEDGKIIERVQKAHQLNATPSEGG